MAQLNPSSLFQSWILSPKELLQGSILTQLQKQCIQNQISAAAAEKTLLKYDPDSALKFLQREAELQGQIGALQYLITLSEEAEKQFDPGLSQIHITPDQPPQTNLF